MADVKQWVNLPRDAKWINHITGDDKPDNIERVGPIRLKVTFKKADHANFKTAVHLKKGVAYVQKEKNRNRNFRIRFANGASSNLGKKMVELERDIFLPAAGGNEYLIKAKYKNKEVEGPKTVEVRRALFYYSVRQDSTGSPNGTAKGGNVDGQIADPTPMLDQLDTEHWLPAEKYYIRLQRKGAFVAAFTHTLGDEYEPDPANPNINRLVDSTRVWRNQTHTAVSGAVPTPLPAGAAKGWNGVWRHTDEWGMLDAVKGVLPRGDAQALKPLCFVAVWCNYIADKAKKIITITGPAVGGAVDTGTFMVVNSANEIYLSTGGKYLWHGFNQAADNARSWLVDMRIDFIDAATGTRTPVNIPSHCVDPIGSSGPGRNEAEGDFGGYTWIKANLSDAAFAAVRNGITTGARGQFEITVTLYVVDNMSAGYAMPGLNIVVICDKANFKKYQNNEKMAVLAHELGHAIGMTAQGGKKTTQTFNGAKATTPNFPTSLYGNIQQGNKENSCLHQGNHCNKGAKWNKGAWDPNMRNSGGGNGRWTGTWSGEPECVMFGAVGLWIPNPTPPPADILKINPSTFCSNCKPIVRKLDLGGNLFASCVTD